MRLTRPARAALMAITLGGALAAGLAPASATATDAATAPAFSSADESFFRNQMTHYDVPAATQDALFAKLRAGQAWDADLEGSVPVSTETRRVDNRAEEISRYADGSIAAHGREVASAKRTGATANSWKGCAVIIGNTYNTVTDCTVDWTRGTTFMQFCVDGRIYHNGFDKISEAHSPIKRFLGGTVTGENLRVTRTWETASSPARAMYTMDVDFYGGIGSRNYNLVLELRNGGFAHGGDF